MLFRFIKIFIVQLIILYFIYILFDFFKIYPAEYGIEYQNELTYFFGLFLYIFILMGFIIVIHSILLYKNNGYMTKKMVFIFFCLDFFYLYIISFLLFKCSNFCALFNDWIRVFISIIIYSLFSFIKKYKFI